MSLINAPRLLFAHKVFFCPLFHFKRELELLIQHSGDLSIVFGLDIFTCKLSWLTKGKSNDWRNKPLRWIDAGPPRQLDFFFFDLFFRLDRSWSFLDAVKHDWILTEAAIFTDIEDEVHNNFNITLLNRWPIRIQASIFSFFFPSTILGFLLLTWS